MFRLFWPVAPFLYAMDCPPRRMRHETSTSASSYSSAVTNIGPKEAQPPAQFLAWGKLRGLAASIPLSVASLPPV